MRTPDDWRRDVEAKTRRVEEHVQAMTPQAGYLPPVVLSAMAPTDDEIQAWLEGPDPRAAEPLPPSDGYRAGRRAMAEAMSHTGCPGDTRDFDVLVGVIGKDGLDTYVQVPPDCGLNCTLRALAQDPEVQTFGVLGRPGPLDLDPGPDETARRKYRKALTGRRWRR